MTLLAFPIGILLPALAGWLLLSALEGRNRVFWPWERWIWGALLGMTLMTFIVFILAAYARMPVTLMNFLTALAIMIIPSGAWWMRERKRGGEEPPAPAHHSSPAKFWRTALWAWTVWVGLRVVAFLLLLFLMPPFFDDTLDNWNLRGKVFFLDHALTLQFPWNNDIPGISSYPPSVPLVKTWMAALAGGWFEPLANGVHLLWFTAAVAIIYGALRRTLTRHWSLFGSVLLMSLPLYLMHGLNAYADVFLSAHWLAAVIPSYLALTERDARRSMTWLRIGALAVALLPFTKNEGWALYFPVAFFVWMVSAAWMMRRQTISRQQFIRLLALALALCTLVVFPWIGFKVMHGLSFGNAKGLDTDFTWHSGVLIAIAVNTFFEGNWVFLFPLLIGLLLFRWKTALTTPVLMLTLAVLIPYASQLFAFLFTGLAQEAIFQTGYARGVIHLMPVMVTLAVLLLHDLISRKNGQLETETGE